MESSKLSKQLESIEIQADQLFDKLVSGGKTVNFLQELNEDEPKTDKEIRDELTETGEVEALPRIELRNSFSGEVSNMYMCVVTEGGISALDDNNTYSVINFRNVASLEDKLVLLNEMENCLNK